MSRDMCVPFNRDYSKTEETPTISEMTIGIHGHDAIPATFFRFRKREETSFLKVRVTQRHMTTAEAGFLAGSAPPSWRHGLNCFVHSLCDATRPRRTEVVASPPHPPSCHLAAGPRAASDRHDRTRQWRWRSSLMRGRHPSARSRSSSQPCNIQRRTCATFARTWPASRMSWSS